MVGSSSNNGSDVGSSIVMVGVIALTSTTNSSVLAASILTGSITGSGTKTGSWIGSVMTGEGAFTSDSTAEDSNVEATSGSLMVGSLRLAFFSDS